MKPPEQIRAELARQWLERAEADWRLCHRLMEDPEPYLEATAFHCQQAAEKYLKAYLTWHQTEFPKTHDIKHLIELIGSCDKALAENIEEAVSLTPYAVEYRYPGDHPQLTAHEVAQALTVADRVRNEIGTSLRDELDL